MDALPGHEHLEVPFVGLDRRGEAGLLALGEPLLGAAQQVPNFIERVVLASSSTSTLTPPNLTSNFDQGVCPDFG